MVGNMMELRVLPHTRRVWVGLMRTCNVRSLRANTRNLAQQSRDLGDDAERACYRLDDVD